MPITVGSRCADFRQEKVIPGEKYSKHRRDQLRELSSCDNHTRLGFSGERHNALQGQINFHLTGGYRFLQGGPLVSTKELTGLSSSSVTVVGYDLVVSPTKL